MKRSSRTGLRADRRARAARRNESRPRVVHNRAIYVFEGGPEDSRRKPATFTAATTIQLLAIDDATTRRRSADLIKDS